MINRFLKCFVVHSLHALIMYFKIIFLHFYCQWIQSTSCLVSAMIYDVWKIAKKMFRIFLFLLSFSKTWSVLDIYISLLNINQPVPILFHTHDQTFMWHVFVCFMGNLQWSWVLSPWINNSNLVSVYSPFSLVYFQKHQFISQIYLRP